MCQALKLTLVKNLPPRTEGYFPRDDDKSTPPGNVPATLGIRHWQRAGYTSPPFGLLSPNSKPSLARQRDHSACRRTDSPLKVRKTRENLKQSSIYGDVPPPCMHGPMLDPGDTVLPPTLSFTSATTIDSKCDCTVGSSHDTGTELTGSTLHPASPHKADQLPLPLSPPPQILGMPLRHKSVSRRMLSRVKEGISHRSRSSHATKSPDAESLIKRRLSGKQKIIDDEQRRMRSFEISRHSSIGSEADAAGDASGSQRSFTDSSITTDDLMATGVTLTPPSAIRKGSGQRSMHLLSPTPGKQSPYGGPTPKASARESLVFQPRNQPMLQACLPYIDMKVSLEREAVDVGVSKDIWIAVEAVVRSRIVQASARNESPTVLNRHSIDAVVVVCRDTLAKAAGLVQQCVVELCCRLDVADDRLALLVTTSRQIDTSTISCICTEIHSLQAPKTSALLERLGLAASKSRNSLPDVDEEYPIQLALKSIATQANSQEPVHAFVLSDRPAHVAQAIEQSMNWPAHLMKIGLCAPERLVPPDRSHHSWLLEIRGEGDICTTTLDNLFRDIRHGYCVGGIPSLRLCYKAMDRSRIVEVVGEKATKDLRLGQRCSLFVKVCIPKIDAVVTTKTESDQDSLLAELESIVGTLESNFLHVEARYRHTVLPTDNVVTVRHICTIRRPKTDSRWSLITSAVAGLSSEHVNIQLARFLALHYAPSKALQAIIRWNLDGPHAVQQLCTALRAQVASTTRSEAEPGCAAPSPAVIVTDTTQLATSASPIPHHVTRTTSAATLSPVQVQRGNELPHSASTSAMIATRIISAPKGTTAISTYGPRTDDSREGTPSDSQDTAHQLWQHLRRDSLSTKQILALSTEKMEEIEDEELKTLHDQALANKRSVGAETLNAWKWEEDNIQSRAAPWL